MWAGEQNLMPLQSVTETRLSEEVHKVGPSQEFTENTSSSTIIQGKLGWLSQSTPTSNTSYGAFWMWPVTPETVTAIWLPLGQLWCVPYLSYLKQYLAPKVASGGTQWKMSENTDPSVTCVLRCSAVKIITPWRKKNLPSKAVLWRTSVLLGFYLTCLLEARTEKLR